MNPPGPPGVEGALRMGSRPFEVSIATGPGPCADVHETTELGGESAAPARVPARVGPYVVLERLGAGGMGVITATGVVIGTPAYMAPEQLRGRATDARGDQFAFCVALFEAAWGHRPFRGRTLGESHPLTASSWMNLGTALDQHGEPEAAREAITTALELKREILGTDHPDVALALNNLGETLRELGFHDEAIAAHRESLAIWSVAQGEHHPHVAFPVTNLGLDFLAKGDLPAAREMLERALAIPGLAALDPALRGTAGFGLAKVLERIREPDSVTWPLAVQARADLGGRTRRYDGDRAELDAWLAAHSPRAAGAAD